VSLSLICHGIQEGEALHRNRITYHGEMAAPWGIPKPLIADTFGVEILLTNAQSQAQVEAPYCSGSRPSFRFPCH